MTVTVTEGKTMRFRRNGSASGGVVGHRFPTGVVRPVSRVVAGVALALELAGPAGGGAVLAQEASTFVARVQNMDDDRQRIVVPVNRSVLVETSVETARADVIASTICDVQPVSPTQLLITGRSFGTTQVILWGEADRRSLLEVSVELDLRALQEAIATIDPQAQVEAKSVQGSIVLTGTCSGAETASRIVDIASLFLPAAGAGGATLAPGGGGGVRNHLRVAGEQQVLLRCIVAEVNRSASRQLGVNGFLAGDEFRDMFVVNQIGSINPINIGAAADASVLSDIPFLTGTEGIPLTPSPTLSLGFPRVQMQLFLRALTDNSLLKIMAEPNLVCISGQTATFLAGGEFPIPVPQGNQQVTIEFREFGVKLDFTPVVNAHQRIRLRVRPEVSETDFSAAIQIQGFAVPGLTNRSAETTVEVGNGQTIAIAGLLSEEVRAVASRIPGMGDLPVLGALFRSVDFRRDLTELVILVTPEIVAAMDPQQVSLLPGQFIAPPTDFELYALGLLEGAPRAAGQPAPKTEPAGGDGDGQDASNLAFRGPWGFSGPQDLR